MISYELVSHEWQYVLNVRLHNRHEGMEVRFWQVALLWLGLGKETKWWPWMVYWVGLLGTGPEAQSFNRSPWPSPTKYHSSEYISTKKRLKKATKGCKGTAKTYKITTKKVQATTEWPKKDTKWPRWDTKEIQKDLKVMRRNCKKT